MNTRNLRRFFVSLMLVITLFAAYDQTKGQEETGNAEEKTWSTAGFTNPEIDLIDSGDFYGKQKQTFTHQFDLTVVIFRGTEWKKKVILHRLQKMADIYARCGVRIGKLTFITAEAPDGMIDFARPGHRDREIAAKVPPAQKPIFFYFRSIPKYNAYAWVEHSDNDEIADTIKNTAWFSLSVAMDLNKKLRRRGYISEAHELGHILLDSQAHEPEGVKNLMAEKPEDTTGELTPEQCRKIKSNPLLIQIDQ